MCGKADLAAVLKLVGGPRGTPADRLRLAIIWLLAYDGAWACFRLNTEQCWTARTNAPNALCCACAPRLGCAPRAALLPGRPCAALLMHVRTRACRPAQ